MKIEGSRRVTKAGEIRTHLMSALPLSLIDSFFIIAFSSIFSEFVFFMN